MDFPSDPPHCYRLHRRSDHRPLDAGEHQTTTPPPQSSGPLEDHKRRTGGGNPVLLAGLHHSLPTGISESPIAPTADS